MPPDKHSQPKRSRPHIPGYGITKKDAGLMEWVRLSRRMDKAHNYWIITTRADGRPHAAPVWGIWMDEVFYFSTGASSVKGRNLARNRSLVVHLESGDDVVILEGTAKRVTNRSTLLQINRVYGAKYNFYPLGKNGKGKLLGPFFALLVRVAFSWLERNFVKSSTRWEF